MSNSVRSLVRGQSGFTIVETLIVIAISSLLLMSAVLLVAGQQRKVEFSQSAQDIRSIIEQVIAETSAGHYPNSGFNCSATASNITITAAAGAAQGSNTNCIFMGRAIQFGNSGDTEAYVLHTITGYQHNDGSLDAAIPEAVNLDSARTIGQIRNGVRVVGMRYTDGTGTHNISAVAFLQGLGEVDSSTNLVSGSQQMVMAPLRNTNTVTTTNIPTVVNSVNAQLDSGAPLNPSGGVQICLASGGTQQWAQITIGSNNRSLSVKLDYKNSVCW